MCVASEIDSDRRETLGESERHCILRPPKTTASVGVCLTNPGGWGRRSYEKDACELLFSVPYRNIFVSQLFASVLVNVNQMKNFRVVLKYFSVPFSPF